MSLTGGDTSLGGKEAIFKMEHVTPWGDRDVKRHTPYQRPAVSPYIKQRMQDHGAP